MNTEIGRFCLDDSGDSTVLKHLQMIRSEILQLGIEPVGLVLAGSFGRGEGLMEKLPDSSFRPINDYDVVIVTERKLSFLIRRNLKELATRLSSQLGLWHLDLINYSLPELCAAEVRMILYDLKFGGQVFFGTPTLLDYIPYSAGRLPDSEIENLLINRCVTLLEAYPFNYRQNFRHCERQLAKALYALMDYLLNSCNQYVTRYQQKRTQLSKLAKNSDPALEELRQYLLSRLDWTDAAWRYQYMHESNATERWEIAARYLVRALLHIITSRTHQTCIRTDLIIQTWRGSVRQNFIKSFLSSLQRSSRHQVAEQRIFFFLKAFPDSHFIPELSLQIPQHSTDDKKNSLWLNMREQLILDWYA